MNRTTPGQTPGAAIADPGRRRIAVIGAGISGMGAAYRLAARNDVVLYESENRLGGHARTRMAGRDGDQAVDTGFIVFNYANYPHLAQLFAELEVPVVKSSMSFGASIAGGRLEYGLASLDALFAQRKNLANPSFWRMCRDILHFNKRAVRAAEEDGLTVGGLMKKLGMGRYFREHYLLPLSGAIWSTPTEKVLDFPAHAMIRFMENHALLGITGQHQWFTVNGGSVEYVTRLGAAMDKAGVQMRLGCPIDGVRRTPDGVWVKAPGVAEERFDEVVLATHSDISLDLLDDADAREKRVLGAIRYQPNDVILHSDESVMPKKRSVWSSWTYAEGHQKSSERIDLTYWMNSLQPWLTDDNLFVTLNTTRPIDESLIWDRVVLQHPVYDVPALAAQAEAAAMNGTNRTWFCGAWMKNGFHEDGLSSAMDVVEGIARRDTLAIAAE